MGFRYDGRVGLGRTAASPPTATSTQALADVGIDPRRVRAWPNQCEIAALFVGARPAPEELLAAAGPDYTAEDVRALLGERGPELADLWLAWEADPTGRSSRKTSRRPSLDTTRVRRARLTTRRSRLPRRPRRRPRAARPRHRR